MAKHVLAYRGGDRLQIHPALFKQYGSVLHPVGLVAYLRLASGANEAHVCCISLLDLGLAIGVSMQTAKRAIETLKGAGLIEVALRPDEPDENYVHQPGCYRLLEIDLDEGE